MGSSIDFREIPLFAFFSSEARQALTAVLGRQIRVRGERIVAFGAGVPGIYIIVEGEVQITLPDFESPLAVLKRGQCIGEMSLVEEGQPASADATVISETAKLLFCAVADFKRILGQVPETGHAFYRGAAMLLSSRLRQASARLNQELSVGQGMIAEVLNSSAVGEHLSKTKSDLEKTGDRVVHKLMVVMPLLDEILFQQPEQKLRIEELQRKIEEVFLVDSQDFDRISQQLHMIQQHFENIRRLANGGAPLPLVGDRNLFKDSAQSS